MLEFALLTPFLMMMALGTYDLGSWVSQSSALRAQARAGIRAAQKSSSVDIGDYIREEGATALPNTLASWGNEYVGGSQAICTSANSACGDTQGCTSNSSFWSTPGGAGLPNPTSCFAVTHCTLVTGTSPSCPLGSWQTRPPGGTNGDLLVIKVVHLYIPATPLLQSVTAPGIYSTYQLQSEVSY